VPVAESSRAPARQALLVGLGAVLGVVAVLFLVLQADRLVGQADLDLDISDGIYRPGPVAELAEGIDTSGPLLLSDTSGGDRDLIVTHTGDDLETGWHAFAARQPAAPRDCFVVWSADERTLVDNCDGTVYPETGEGLPQYPVAVDGDGILSIDLNSAPRVAPAPSTDPNDDTTTGTGRGE